jgi:GNAT superfamily N-acetyltransferase
VTSVRAGGYDDCAAVARLQVAAWRAAYAGLVPDPVLARLDVGERVRRWLALLERGVALLVAVDEVADAAGDGRSAVVGYASCGASRDEDARAGVGELYALYVDPRRWRSGVGRRLHDAALAALRAERSTSATLWVLAGNTAGRAFYEALGWRQDGVTRVEQVEGGALEEHRYARRL